MKTGYAHEVEAPFLAHWPDADIEIEWNLYRVVVELNDNDEIDSAAMHTIVSAYGAGNISIEAWATANCTPRLRIVAELERP